MSREGCVTVSVDTERTFKNVYGDVGSQYFCRERTSALNNVIIGLGSFVLKVVSDQPITILVDSTVS